MGDWGLATAVLVILLPPCSRFSSRPLEENLVCLSHSESVIHLIYNTLSIYRYKFPFLSLLGGGGALHTL